tara:strand:+ start:1047 stop:1481 length:435 start_codon:yes stop_codon:yes gene_type:complete
MEPLRTYYAVEQKAVVVYTHMIEATSKADALRKFEEDGWQYEGDASMSTDKWYNPKAERLWAILECPNKGEGWSDIPLDKLTDMGFDDLHWHYNGKCDGERNEHQTHCYECLSAMQTGKRLLTLEEKRYLKNRYPENKDLNTEE